MQVCDYIPLAHLWWDCIGPLRDLNECQRRPNYYLIIYDSARLQPDMCLNFH